MRDQIGRFKNVHLNFVPPPLMRAIALRRITACDLSFPDVAFKIAASEEEMTGAFSLLEESYVRRGITRAGQMRPQVVNLLPSTTTFVAMKGDQILGTLSLIEDSDLGLPMEKVHPEEVAGARKLFRRIAEVGSLAVVPDQRRAGLSIMLYNMMYRWARHWRHIDDLLIAVHPSARFFYRNILLFRRLGAVRRYEGLSGAASLPMLLDIPGAQMRFHDIYRDQIIDRCRGVDFYDFFCAPDERFDYSSHPEFSKQQYIAGPLSEGVVNRLLNRFVASSDKLAESEADALRRHFPRIEFAANGAV